MGFFTNLEHSAESGIKHLADDAGHVVSDLSHDVVNSARVGATLAEGAWDYATTHPGEMAKTAAIAVGTGLAIGAATAFFPECAILGAALTIAGGVGGAVGLASLGEQTFESLKHAAPDLKIVWNADEHSQADVQRAEVNVKSKTGEAMANDALILPSFFVGNIAGNLGADAGKAVEGAMFSSSAAAAEGSAAAGVGAAADAGASAGAAADTTAGAAQSSSNLWAYLNHNPLEDRTDVWTAVNNNNAYGLVSNYYLENADLQYAARMMTRFLANPSGAANVVDKYAVRRGV